MMNKSALVGLGMILLASSASGDNPPVLTPSLNFEIPKSDGYTLNDPNTLYIGEIDSSQQDGKKNWNLRLQTADDQLCANAHINAVSYVNGDHVTVSINKTKPLLQPSVCVTNFSPATFWTTLPAFGKPLTIDIVNGGKDDRYKVTLATNGGSVNVIHASFTILKLDSN